MVVEKRGRWLTKEESGSKKRSVVEKKRTVVLKKWMVVHKRGRCRKKEDSGSKQRGWRLKTKRTAVENKSNLSHPINDRRNLSCCLLKFGLHPLSFLKIHYCTQKES